MDPRGDCRDRQLPGGYLYTRDGECSLWVANTRWQWSIRPVLGSETTDPVVRAANDRVRPGVTVTDGGVLPP